MGQCSQTQLWPLKLPPKKDIFQTRFWWCTGLFVEILIGQGQALGYRTAVSPDPIAFQCLIGTWATPQRE